MKIINFGSLNIDKVYSVDDFVKPGQTIFSNSFNIFPGGKGLNQSIAAARADATVLHAGAIGDDGLFLKKLLEDAGADTSVLRVLDTPSGHAIIEVSKSGQNRIIVTGGTNRMMTETYIEDVLSRAEAGDIVLLQNETNLIDRIITKSAEKGCRIVFNPSPMPTHPEELPLDKVSVFMVNEIEAAQIAGINMSSDHSIGFTDILDLLQEKFPNASIVMTLGGNGVLYASGEDRYNRPIFKVTAVDTTAAGDTFCGYFLAAICAGKDVPTALKEASAASAIAVSRPGAAPSIPYHKEVEEFIASRE